MNFFKHPAAVAKDVQKCGYNTKGVPQMQCLDMLVLELQPPVPPSL